MTETPYRVGAPPPAPPPPRWTRRLVATLPLPPRWRVTRRVRGGTWCRIDRAWRQRWRLWSGDWYPREACRIVCCGGADHASEREDHGPRLAPLPPVRAVALALHIGWVLAIGHSKHPGWIVIQLVCLTISLGAWLESRDATLHAHTPPRSTP